MVLVEERAGRARVVSSLGRPDNARDVCEALVLDRLGSRGFPAGLEEETARIVAGGPDHSVVRTDLTGLPTFTVDPEAARDFDDAVSAERVDDDIRLWIHIADVSAWVRDGSDLDREALRRGNSVYVPTSVEPMLPHLLSSGECSLSPGDERLAVTTEVILSPEGEVRKVSFYRSRIRSDARLDYGELDRIFEGRSDAPNGVGEAIDLARRAASILGTKREQGRLEISSGEPEFVFDDEGNVLSSDRYHETESHRLIEHLMILVNEQVAEMLERRSAPTAYRVHEQPDPDRVERLFGQLASLDLPTPPFPDGAGPTTAGMLAVEASRTVAAEALRRGHGRRPWGSLVLRSLKPARYSERNLGHAGLGSRAYCHFTSPIRRYPDLLVHRSLLAEVGAGETTPSVGEVAEASLHCSETERTAALIERDADDVCSAFLLERELFEEGWDRRFEGEVTGVIGAGAFVTFEGTIGKTYEGFLPARRLGGERFEVNDEETALVGTRTGRRVGFGDRVGVEVTKVRPVEGKVDLSPA